MRVWLIKIGEPLPVVDGPSIRKMRMSLLADQLVAAGHEVVWWASTFSHAKKAHRFPDDKVVDVSDSFQIRMMKALGYSRSRSPARIIDHCLLARRFARLARRQERPDVIVSAMPTPGLSRAAGEYGRQFGVPVVVDIRDLWPDCYVEPARGLKRALTWLAFRPMARTLRKACRLATAITGISRPAVDWAVGYAGREPTADDRVVPHGYTRRRPTDEQIERARAFWADRGIPDEPGRFIACFFGYFGADYDIESVIEAARILQAGGLSMTFALCGEGDRLASCRELAREVPGVVLPGWVGLPSWVERVWKSRLAWSHNSKTML